MAKGYMTARIEFKHFYAELTGSNAKVWIADGDADYDGTIDGIEEKYPGLWKHLIDEKCIKSM